jgi:hypothetical protein
MPCTITDIVVRDIRFPTSRELDGSDAMNPDPDYSAAYVVLKTDHPDGMEGHGLTFTIGRGKDVFIRALRYSPDGRLVFAVAGEDDGPATFHVLTPVDLLQKVLHLLASDDVLSLGSPVTLTARLEDHDDTTNRTVSIYGHAPDGSRQHVATGEIDANGEFSTTIIPRANTTYVAEWSGDERYRPASSARRDIEVSPRLRARLKNGFSRAGSISYGPGRKVGLGISSQPALDLRVVVRVERRTPWWTSAGRVELRLGSDGQATTSLDRITQRPGTYRAKVFFGGNQRYSSSSSRWAGFRRLR